MSPPLSSLHVDELDESTRPYTHSQIDDMRKLVADASGGPGDALTKPRVYKVNIERFARFGEAGTPAGMIGSEGAVSRLVVGSCGAQVEGAGRGGLGRGGAGGTPRRRRPPSNSTSRTPSRPLPRPPSQPSPGSVVAAEGLGIKAWGPSADDSGDTDGVPIVREGVLEWAPTLVYGAATSESGNVELPPEPLASASSQNLGAGGTHQGPQLHARAGEGEPAEAHDGPQPRAPEPSGTQARPQLRVPAPTPEPELDTDEAPHELEPARRRKWIPSALGVSLLGLALGLWWVWVAPEPEPEPKQPSALAEATRPAPKAEPPPRKQAGRSEAVEVLEDELEDELEHSPEPEQPGSERARKTPVRKTPAHETKACVQTRQEAAQAMKEGAWSRVVTLTAKGKCWSKADKVELERMRMTALFELGRPGECVKVGEGSNHSEIVTLRKRCTLAQK